MYNRVIYLINVKKIVTYVISHNNAKIKVDSYNSLLLEKTMTFHNVMTFIESVWNKDKNNHYYNKFLEKSSNELTKK